jgi:hypothetical protein
MRSVRRDVPAALEAVFSRAMAAAPGDRFPDMTAFSEALAESGEKPLLSRLFRR